MKKIFKKSLAVFMAVLMLVSVFSVVASAANFVITYMPGEGVEGEVIVDKKSSASIKLRGVTYTREHYTQKGWATTENGPRAYSLGATYRIAAKPELTLYPYWVGDTYTITYEPGAYGTGAKQTTTAEYGASAALLGAVFTREGYVQIGWSTEDGGEKVYDLNAMSAAVTGDLTLYPYFAQIYNIVYSPGEFGVGEEKYDTVESGKTFTITGAIFTRDGYTQVGWSTEDGGSKAYDLLQNFVSIDEDTVFYPYWLKSYYGISVSAKSAYFGDLCEGYNVPEAQVFTITNAGNVPETFEFSNVENFDVTIPTETTIAAGNSLTITVAPKAGLALDEYSETISITIKEDDEISAQISLDFSVSEHVFGKYIANDDATYSADGTKTAECVKGCGCTDTIADPGSMKVYSIDNNDAVGLSTSYVHHRTVRFTAYGSGMDDAEGVVGKRFVPVSWYVSEEYNGTFDDGDYEVVFTHTLFGKYTLTINFVEEELNAETGEWVATGVTDEKTFDYTVGTNAYEEQEIVRPNTIVSIIFGLLTQLLSLLGLGE